MAIVIKSNSFKPLKASYGGSLSMFFAQASLGLRLRLEMNEKKRPILLAPPFFFLSNSELHDSVSKGVGKPIRM